MTSDGSGGSGSMPVGPPFPRCEHVWVTRQARDNPRSPGVLLAFRKDRRGRWEGWVVWATSGIPAHGGETHLQLGWVDAARSERRDGP